MEHFPIQITPTEAGRLKVVLPYRPDRIAKIRGVKGRCWHADGRYWTVPRTDETISHLLTLFAGEPVEVEASLRSTTGQNPGHKPEVREDIASNLALLDQVRQAIRRRHYSHKTEEAYVGWIKRFLLFHHQRHPAEIAEQEIGRVPFELGHTLPRERVNTESSLERRAVPLL